MVRLNVEMIQIGLLMIKVVWSELCKQMGLFAGLATRELKQEE